MYDELIKRLRDCRNMAVYSKFWWDITTEAADAIEELCMKLDGDEAAIAGMKCEIERMVIAAYDAVPVVRCKDCKHTLKGNNGALVCCLTKMVGTTDPNWFCADGERKGE